MRGDRYRERIRGIAKAVLQKRFPGLKKKEVEEAVSTIAVGVHAALYGANVDGVESPIWRQIYAPERQPDVDASKIIQDGTDEKVNACLTACAVSDK